MTAINATNNVTNNAFAAAQSTASAKAGSIVLLAFGIAIMRAVLVIVGAVSLGAAARFFFPEMFAIPSNPVTLLAAVAADTFAVVAGALMVSAKSGSKSR